MVYIISFIFLVLVILWGINLYLIKSDKLQPWEWQLNALGLPRGSVRAILAIGFIAMLIFSSLEEIAIPELPEWAIGITGSIVGFYFGAASTRPPRREEQQEKTEPEVPPTKQE